MMLVQVVLRTYKRKLQVLSLNFKIYKLLKNELVESAPEIVSGHILWTTENSISNVEIVVSPPET